MHGLMFFADLVYDCVWELLTGGLLSPEVLLWFGDYTTLHIEKECKILKLRS